MGRRPKPGVQIRDIADVMSETLKKYQSEILSKTTDKNIVDIITFAEEFVHTDFSRFPYMKIVLKLFYYKTLGNENLEITEEDIECIKSICNYNAVVPNDYLRSLEDDKDILKVIEDCSVIENLLKEWGGNYWLGEKINILKNPEYKINPFDYLVLVLGRRSGKTFISALIASYEVYKLLSIITCKKCKEAYNLNSGDSCPVCGGRLLNYPQAYYKNNGFEPLRIQLAATKVDQAKDPMLKYVINNLVECDFFDGKWTHVEGDGIIYFRSEADEEYAEKMSKSGQPDHKGSVVVRTVGANSKGAHGQGAVLSIFDEFALFNQEGAHTDESILEALVPATSLYRELRGDGRIILISAPDLPEGKFYEHYVQGINIEGHLKKKEQEEKYKQHLLGDSEERLDYYDLVEENYFDQHLVFQMPTWEYNSTYTLRSLIGKYGAEFGGDPNSVKFKKVYGGQFVSMGSEIFIPHRYIESAIDYTRKKLPVDSLPDMADRYFMHIDWAGTGSANYACLVGHWQMNRKTGTKSFYEDTSFYWSYSQNGDGTYEGSDGEKYDIDGVNRKLIEIAKTYSVYQLTYDLMQSEESKLRFKQAGIHLKSINFSGLNGGNIYGLLLHLFQDGKIVICNDDYLLIEELKNLRRLEEFRGRGLKITTSKSGLIKTKDVADCLAGVVYSSYDMPMGRTGGLYFGGFSATQPSSPSIFGSGVQGFGFGPNRSFR